ncbi:unnamed protein product [Schistocephalus solidus]|uniref:RH1 domain-containing protein n=1 Tax=Schistocephalus solidus TaxID=70667 RepID=A0A183T1J8_SCHSO|nr:unnamed protein product [Schistocephalus solidus]
MSDVMRVVVDSAQDAAITNNTLFLSPHIRDLATSVYEEFKNQVARHGEGAVDRLAPIVIRILERVDELHEANEMTEVRLGVLQAEVHSLNLRVERETSLRKAAEARVITLDDEYADTKSTLEKHITELTGLVRILQTKQQNAAAHGKFFPVLLTSFLHMSFLITRKFLPKKQAFELWLEEKEAELRKELANAQARYNDLLRTHVAHIERCRRAQREQPAYVSCSKSPTATDTTNIARSLSPTEASSLPSESVQPVSRAFQESDMSSLARKEMPEEEMSSPRIIHHEQKKPTVPSLDVNMFADLTGFLLEDPSDYEAQLISQPTTEQNDDTEDLISSELNQRKMQTTEAARRILHLEAEVARLTSRICENLQLSASPLSPLSHGSGDGPSVRRSSSLTRDRNNELRLEQANGEEKSVRLRSQSCSNIRHFADDDYRCVPAAELPASTAAPTAAAGAVTVKPPLAQSQATAQAPSNNPAQRGPKTVSVPGVDEGFDKLHEDSVAAGANSVRFTRREMARVVVERNYYKRKFLELQETVQYSAERGNTGALQLRQPTPSRGSRLSSFASGALNTVQSLAADVVQSFDQLFSDATLPLPSTERAPVSDDRSSQTRTSTALWNLLGNFVGQAVTYTADAVISTGSGLLRDVARPVIPTDVRSGPHVRVPTLDDLPPGCIGRAVSMRHPVPCMSAKVCTISSSLRQQREKDSYP